METQSTQAIQKSKWCRFKLFLLSPLSPAMKWGLLSCLLIALGFGGVGFVALLRPYGFIPALIFGLALLIAGLILSVVVTLLFAAVKRLRWQVFLVIFVSIILTVLTLLLAVYVIPLMIFCMIGVYLAIMFATGQYKTLRKPKKILRYGLLVISSATVILMLVLIIWPGPLLSPGDRPEVARLALPYYGRVQSRDIPALSNPSFPGSYSYAIHFYASAEQRIAPFPGQVTLLSQTVDMSEILNGWSGLRRSRLGFGPDALPLNAQVWMPEGEGPFPITLMVHGNHTSGNRSDGGYAYLGELLASRGIIAASVDQNFLNGSNLYDILSSFGLERENGVRAIILLEHLRQWHAWNADPSHVFYNKVDFDNIALIGHSRGGEAAALAAALADLYHYPGNGSVILGFPFSINTVVAIAPTHRQYNPAGMEVSLTGVNYLVLHGGHDKDVSSFMGSDMYSMTDVSDYGMKASVWIKHANHGQFNTIWGRNDMPGLMRLATNRRLLMPLEEQQTMAKVFISAFLEATLHGRDEYAALFRDFAHGADWLPPALYVTDFMDSNMKMLDSFDSGFDLSTSTSQLVSYSAQGFDKWTFTELSSKFRSTNRVLMLQWGDKDSTQTPIFKAEFAKSAVCMGDRLYVSLSSGNRNYNNSNVSFQIRLTDAHGRTSTMHINDFGGVTNPIDAHIFSPLAAAIMGSTSEPVLQMVSIPTELFEGLQGEIVSMEWIMETSEAVQTLYVDDLRVERLAS